MGGGGGDGGWAMTDFPCLTPWPEAEMEQKQTERTKSFTGLVTLVGFCDVRLPRFPIAPTAHLMRAQTTGLGIGHQEVNPRAEGLKYPSPQVNAQHINNPVGV